MHTNTSDFAIDGVLVQYGHCITYENDKLNDTKLLYTMQEKEMTTMILPSWIQVCG